MDRLLCFSLLFLVAAAAPARAQSVADCQRASRLYAEAQVIQDLFRKFSMGYQGPSLGFDEQTDANGNRTGPPSLQTTVKDELNQCQSSGSGPASCSDYKRIRDATIGGPGGGSSAYMYTDPQSCKIHDANSGKELSEADAPAGGVDRAVWLSAFKHEQFHQSYCRSMNGNTQYPSTQTGWNNNPSPYLNRMRDPVNQANEEITAYEITKEELEDYLKDNCADPDLEISVKNLVGGCKQTATGSLTLKSKAAQAKQYALNTASDWLGGVAGRDPVSVPPNGENKVDMEAGCRCCGSEKKSAEVSVYGGPGRTILVGKPEVGLDCKESDECGNLSGDPHLRTYDGLAYDFQAVGEFVLARGEGFEVQVRLQPHSASRRISIGMAVAARVNSDRVAIYGPAPATVRINGRPTKIEAGEQIRLRGGGLLARDERYFRLTAESGFVLEVRPHKRSLTISVGLPPKARGAGLFGSQDGKTANDIRTVAGAVLGPDVTFDDLYGAYCEGWRVTSENSLFDYAEGESPETFADPSYPEAPAHPRHLPEKARREAEEVCRRAGVSDPIHFENCVLDVGVTGDEEFAQIAAQQSPAKERIEVRPERGSSGPTPKSDKAPTSSQISSASADGITVSAPSKGLASFPFEVEVQGPATPDYHLEIAAAGAGPREREYMQRLSSGSQTVSLRAPTLAGQYEIRYVPRSMNDRQVLIRLPLEIVDPVARIEAPETAPAGGEVEARCVGQCSPNAGLTVVPAGSVHTEMGPREKLDRVPGVTIRRLPEQPGEYEIRYQTLRGRPRRVYARKPIRLVAPGGAPGGAGGAAIVSAPPSSELSSASGAGVTLTAPSQGLASFPFEVELQGTATPDYNVELAPAGAAPSKPVARYRLSNGSQIASFNLPALAGQYEIRYVPRRMANRQVLIRLPLEIVDPAAQIEAPEKAPAGGEVKVRCAGQCSPNAFLVVVPASSPGTERGPRAGLGDGPEVIIRNLPKRPGQYEIRYQNISSQEQQVYARKPIRLE